MFSLRPARLVRLFACLLTPALLAACASAPPYTTGRDDVRQILLLQKARLDVAAPVARSKWNSGAPIDDPVREAAILDDVSARALKLGLDDQWTRRFFQDQFDAGKMVQHSLHGQWQLQQRPPFANPPDLAKDVRPVLDRLTPQILTVLSRLSGHRCDQEVRISLGDLAPAILGSDYSSAVQQKALSALYCPL